MFRENNTIVVSNLIFLQSVVSTGNDGSSGGGKAQSLLQKVGGPRPSKTTSTHPGHHL